MYFEGRNNIAPDNGANRVHQESHEGDVNQTPRFEAELQDNERCQCLTASERDSFLLGPCVFISSFFLFMGAIIFALVVIFRKTTPLELGTSITIVCL